MKKHIAQSIIAFTLVLTLTTYSAVVSDNDGSAFITKAEFDSLKNNFQSQIDNYNNQIDSKIDSAIASYLSGIKISSEEKLVDYVQSVMNSIDSQYGNYFADKTTFTNASNNSDYWQVGTWLWLIAGWNKSYSTYVTMLNLTSGYYTNHELALSPGSVSGKRYYLGYNEVGSTKYFGPYDATLVKPEMQVYARQIISNWSWKPSSIDTIASSDIPVRTWDLSSLKVPGTMVLPAYTIKSYSFSPEGTVILSYSDDSINNYIWGSLNSQGKCDTSTNTYSIKNKNAMDLEVKKSDYYNAGGNPGWQYQNFDTTTRAHTSSTSGKKTNVWYYTFNIPETKTYKNSELYNWVATKVIEKPVTLYNGLPVTQCKKTGKVTLKFKVEALKSSDLTTKTGVTCDVKIKSEPFKNDTLASETGSTVLWTKNSITPGDWVEANFDYNAASVDPTTLYIKAYTGTADTILKITTDASTPPVIKYTD